jgi:hypothetical protein
MGMDELKVRKTYLGGLQSLVPLFVDCVVRWKRKEIAGRLEGRAREAGEEESKVERNWMVARMASVFAMPRDSQEVLNACSYVT